MGRRSSHTPDELRELIIAAATELIDADGLEGLSARAIARRIGYSPGTIYNVFRDLDELLFTIQTRLLDHMIVRIEGVAAGMRPEPTLSMICRTYIEVALERPRLWGVLIQHQPKRGIQLPAEFKDRLDVVLDIVTRAAQPDPRPTDPELARETGRAVWAAVHGIASIATTDKMPVIKSSDALAMVDNLIGHYVRGLSSGPATIAPTSANRIAGGKKRLSQNPA